MPPPYKAASIIFQQVYCLKHSRIIETRDEFLVAYILYIHTNGKIVLVYWMRYISSRLCNSCCEKICIWLILANDNHGSCNRIPSWCMRHYCCYGIWWLFYLCYAHNFYTTAFGEWRVMLTLICRFTCYR